MEKFIVVSGSQQSLIERALTLASEKIEIAIKDRGICTLVLSGGSTPKPLYEALAQKNFPWEKIHIFWGDERYVPPTHPDSNELMARKALLERVPIPEGNIHPMKTNGNNPALDAEKYEEHLRQWFHLNPPQFPVFDLVLLGMGDDGHTASLFPHTEALQVRDRCVTVGNKDGQPRITLTVPVINQARCVVFLVAGASKQEALTAVLAPTGSEQTYPARLIQPQGELWWLLDQDAAQRLKRD